MTHPLYHDICTVFNRIPTGKDETWIKTVMTCVQWRDKRGARIAKSGVTTADALTIRVRRESSKLKYMDPTMWTRLPNEEKSQYWTAQKPGTAMNTIVVKGDCAYDHQPEENLLNELRKISSDVFSVTNIDAYIVGDDVLDHWVIWGK